MCREQGIDFGWVLLIDLQAIIKMFRLPGGVSLLLLLCLGNTCAFVVSYSIETGLALSSFSRCVIACYTRSVATHRVGQRQHRRLGGIGNYKLDKGAISGDR